MARNKTIFLPWLLFIIMSFHMVTVCLAQDPNSVVEEFSQDPAKLYRTAEGYLKNEYYDKAKQLYQQLLDTCPDDDYYAIRGWAGLAKTSLALGEIEAADATVEKLLADYANNNYLPTCLCNIAQFYQRFEKHTQALRFFQHVLDNWPQARYAMWSQVGVIKSHISLDNTTVADAAFVKLLSDYSENEDIAAAVVNIGQHYHHKLGDYEKAEYFYQYTVDNWPEDDYATWCRQGLLELRITRPANTPDEWAQILTQINLAKSNIAQGDTNAAQAVIDKLLADYADNPRLPEAIYDIALYCVDSAVYQTGAELHLYFLQRWPENPKAIWARMGLAEAYAALGNAEAAKDTTSQMLAALPQNDPFKPDTVWTAAYVYYQLQSYEQAIQYYQEILDDWPDCKYAWSAQAWIGQSYEMLKENGSLPPEQVNPLIEQAYQKLIQNYPDCSLIGHANLKLAGLAREQNLWPETADYLNLFLQESQDDPRVPTILYQLGEVYELMDENELAVSVYQVLMETLDPNSPIAEDLEARFPQLTPEGESQ